MSDSGAFQLVVGERTIDYPTYQAVLLDVINQLQEGDKFSVIDPDGNTFVSGEWHMTPSRFT
jgi:hypothetical protein